MHFDWTINLGNLVASVTFIVMAGIAWTDLRWRVKNLETWRSEHTIDSDSRDEIIVRMDKILYNVTGGAEGKGVYIRRDSDRHDYNGPERRRK